MAKQRRARARPPATRPRRGRTTPSAARPPRSATLPESPARAKSDDFVAAVALYERGVEALQRHDYAAGAGRFREVLEHHPEERELHERARLYLRICERELAPKADAPQTLEETLYAATIALNAGHDDQAYALLTKAAAEAPDNGHVHYMLAAVLARRDARDEALAQLRRATALDPDTRLLARRDADFEDLHDDEEFLRITEPPAATGRRRPRARASR